MNTTLEKTTPLNAALASLAGLSISQLRAELVKSFKLTVDQIVRMAAIVRRLEEQGDTLDDLNFSLLGYLRKVAYGQVIPDVIVKFQGAPMLLARVVSLPLPDQDRVLSDKPLKVTVIQDGKTDHRLCEPLRMTPAEVAQVFARSGIRSESEQLTWLRNRPARLHASAGVTVDARRKGIVVSGEKVFISRSEMVNLLARVTD